MRDRAQSRPYVLICTCDVDFYLLLDHVLQSERYTTQFAGSVDEIVEASSEHPIHAILLDCRHGSVSATEACLPLRRHALTRQTPIIALMDQGAERDYVDLVKAGVNDIFVRPILPAKLIECVKMLSGNRVVADAERPLVREVIHFADLEMDLVTYRVRRGGQDIHLSPIEFKILRYLIEHPEQVATRDELRKAAWQENVHVGPRTVDVHVGRLRRALLSVSNRNLIRTVRAVGYALSDQETREV